MSASPFFIPKRRSMGKKKEVKAEPVAVVEPVAAKVEVGPKYRVHLNCPTPIEFRILDVEAKDEQEAWKKYCEANGISDSVHEKTIELIGA